LSNKTKQNKNIMEATANKSKRTFTLRDKGNKYRTQKMSKQEFESAYYYWTSNDWKQFLKTDEYSIVK